MAGGVWADQSGCFRQFVGLRPQPNGVTQGSPSAKLRDLCGRARLPSMGGIGLNIPRKSHRRGHEGTQSLNWSSITVSPIPDAGWRNLVPASDESGNTPPLVVASVVYPFLMNSRIHAPRIDECTRPVAFFQLRLRTAPLSLLSSSFADLWAGIRPDRGSHISPQDDPARRNPCPIKPLPVASS